MAMLLLQHVHVVSLILVNVHHDSREKFLRRSKNFGSIVEPLRVVGPNMDKDVDHSSKWATSTWTMTLLMMKTFFHHQATIVFSCQLHS